MLVLAPAVSAVRSGKYKGTDLTFRVKKNRISKVKVVLTYSCQWIGTGDLPDGEVRQLTVPGKFKIRKKGKVSGYRYIGTYGEIRDISFEWKGRFRKGKLKTVVQSRYNYWGYRDGRAHLVSCYSNTTLKAKRKR